MENDIFSGPGKVRELVIGHGSFRKYLKSQGIYKLMVMRGKMFFLKREFMHRCICLSPH